MSRGHGSRQRELLSALDRMETFYAALGEAPGAWCSVLFLAGEEPTGAEVESVRRAAKTLAAEGLLQTRLAPSGRLEVRLSVEARQSRRSGQHIPPWLARP